MALASVRKAVLAAAFGLLPALLALPAAPALGAASTLRDLAAARGVYMGDGIEWWRINGDATYAQIMDREFNMLTPGNEMKWDATEPSRNSFSYANADSIVTHAAASGQKVRGHTLVWHSQLPSWLNNGTFTGTELSSIMSTHIANVAGHFKGKLYAWDVVNEPFNEDGTRRASIFQTKIGDGYIADALRAARTADPAAKLYLNDYNIDGVNAKSDAMYNLVKSLKTQGVPIDGVGLQAHLILGQVPSTMQQNIQRFADLGVDVAITELDIRMQTPSDATKLASQRADYTKVMQACLAVTRCVGVTVWGLSDKDSWIPSVFPGEGAALLWDDNYNPKPAYYGVQASLGGSTSGDTQAPSTPGTPAASNITSSGATLSWTASTDNVGVTGYDIVNAAGTVLASPATNSATLTGLTASTAYTLRVIAKDAAGNRSTASGAVTFTTTAGSGTGACKVSYSASSWNDGFTASITITNTGTSALTAWTLKFAFAGNQKVTQGWSANWTQSGTAVTATNLSYNGALAAGQSTGIGFNGSYSGTNTNPSAFTLNGQTCASA